MSDSINCKNWLQDSYSIIIFMYQKNNFYFDSNIDSGLWNLNHNSKFYTFSNFRPKNVTLKPTYIYKNEDPRKKLMWHSDQKKHASSFPLFLLQFSVSFTWFTNISLNAWRGIGSSEMYQNRLSLKIWIAIKINKR